MKTNGARVQPTGLQPCPQPGVPLNPESLLRVGHLEPLAREQFSYSSVSCFDLLTSSSDNSEGVPAYSECPIRRCTVNKQFTLRFRKL